MIYIYRITYFLIYFHFFWKQNKYIPPTWHPYFKATEKEFNNLAKEPQPQTKDQNEDLSAQTDPQPKNGAKKPKKKNK